MIRLLKTVSFQHKSVQRLFENHSSFALKQSKLIYRQAFNFCTVQIAPSILKTSIKLGADARYGQEIQKTLEQDFTEIESIKNPLHSQHSKKLIHDIYVKEEFLTVQQLSDFLQLDEGQLFQKLTQFGANPSRISLKEANIIALEYDMKIYHQSERKALKYRPPVVTIMGHVDHGKTTLLDFLRNSEVAKGEFGGITQKIGAFHVQTPEGQRITFIDTPGHEAFSNMRVRGANSTDLIILVVSAIEGIQPQTLEVIKLAYQHEVSMIVAINKIDVPGARPELIEKQLNQKGKLDIEPFGGNIPVIHISAKNGTNMDLLQELILFEAELMELKEVDKITILFDNKHTFVQEYDTLAEGIVLESRRDRESDEKSCTIVIQKGTLKVGDFVIIGNNFCKIRSIKDDKKQILKQAFPSYAVEIVIACVKKSLQIFLCWQTGIKDLPQSGDVIFAVETEQKAKLLSQRRTKNEEDLAAQEEQFIEGSGSKLKFATKREKRAFFSGNRDLIEQKYGEVESRILEKITLLTDKMPTSEQDKSEQLQQINKLKGDLEKNKKYMANLVGNVKVGNSINLIIKANDFGTKETLIAQILKTKLDFPDCSLNIISASVGPLNESEIRDAELFDAKILGMEIQMPREVESQIKAKGIVVKSHRIIYTLLDDIKALLEAGPEEEDKEEQEEERGTAKIMSVIEIKANKTQIQYVAGCKVLKGKLSKKFLFRVERNGEIIEKDLEVANLRHFKKEVEDIKEGNECGLIFFKFNEFEEGDQIIAYEKA